MRLLTAICSMTCSFLSIAGTLTPEEAMQRVYALSDSPDETPAMTGMKVAKTFTGAAGEAMVYLFVNDDNEWMAVGGSEVSAPLLGYGGGHISGADIPPQMKWWLEEYARSISHADSLSHICDPTSQVAMTGHRDSNRNTASGTERMKINPLLSTKWNQDHPYNRFCPEIGIHRTLPGSSATALAQIMKFYQYPESATGVGHATLGKKHDPLEMDLELPLRWNDMLDTYIYGNYDTNQSDAVAELMVRAGYACNTNFTQDYSFAMDFEAANALVENFGYSESTWLYLRDFYLADEWEEMIYEELAEGRPVYYAGTSRNEGRRYAFVCDGYDCDGYFHFNWGWGGNCDGYFKLDVLNPNIAEAPGYDDGYNYSQLAIMGIEPWKEGARHPAPGLSAYTSLDSWIDNDDNMDFYGRMYNYCYKTEIFTVAIEVTNCDEGTVVYQEIGTFEMPPFSECPHFSTRLDPECFDEGRYKIRLVTKTGEYPEWTPVSSLVDWDIDNYTYCIMYEGEWIMGWELPLKMTAVSCPETITVGDRYMYTVKFENPNPDPIKKRLRLYVTSMTEEGNDFGFTWSTDFEDDLRVYIDANSEETFSHYFSIDYYDERVGWDTDLLLRLNYYDEAWGKYDYWYTVGMVRMTEKGNVPAIDLSNRTASIYTIFGTKVDGDIRSLSPGVYVVDGQKVIIR